MPTIVMVEDDLMLAQMYQARFALERIKVELVSHGSKAHNAIKKHQPDLVILDVMLPGKDGFEILTILKDDPDLKDIPVIMFTAIQDANKEKEAKDMGAHKFMSKSRTEPKQLIAAVKKVIGRK